MPDYPFLPKGARTDDDNDFEWTHLYFMDKEDTLKIPYPRLAEIWKANMNTGLWCANLQARKLMDAGMLPPEDGQPGAQFVRSLQSGRSVLRRGLRHDFTWHAADRSGHRRPLRQRFSFR